jgi:hypothetical protein
MASGRQETAPAGSGHNAQSTIHPPPKLLGGSREDDEAGADAAEVRDAVDDGGAVKITD